MRITVSLLFLSMLLVLGGCDSDKPTDTNESAKNEPSEKELVINEDTLPVHGEKIEKEIAIDYESPDSLTVLVNKQHSLPDDYEPSDLTVPDVRFPFIDDDPKKQLRKEAADALEELFVAAEEEGYLLFAQSGYRSFERQEAIFATNVDKDGEEAANKYSARPGQSEHQTGLVMDITSEAIDYRLEVDFGETDEGKWVANNAHNFGYIIRYDKGKEEITQYQYEPWHLRYVGKEAAKIIYEEDLTLEEYVGVIK